MAASATRFRLTPMACACVKEMVDERGNIVGPLVQGGQPEGDDVEPVVEIFTKDSLGDQLVDVAMGRRHEPDVEGDHLATTQPPDLMLLENPKEIDLSLGGHLANFVKKKRALLRNLEPAGLASCRPGIGPFLIAKQFALDQAFGNGTDVRGDERAGAAPAQVVDGTGD